MTISTTTNKDTYTGNGTTVAFPTTFPFYEAIDLEVVERAIVTGEETVKALNTHYTVTGGGGATGTVTALSPPPATVQWVIRRRTPKTQEIDYVENDPFPAETHEEGLDRAAMRIIDMQEQVDRSLKFRISDPASSVGELPASTTRKNKLAGYDSAGKPTTFEPTDVSLVTVTATGSTTARSAAERFSEVKNVLDYGAAGDGVTDDSTAVLLALAAAESAGAPLYFPAGIYNMDAATLDIDAPIRVFGDGPLNTTLAWTKTSGNAVEIGSESDGFLGLVLENLTLEGPSDANVASPSQTTIGVHLNPAGTASPATTNGVLRNVRIRQFYQAIYADDAWNWGGEHLIIQLCNQGLFLKDNSDTILFNRCSFANCWTLASVTNCGGVIFFDCNFNESDKSVSDGFWFDIFQSVMQVINGYWENGPADGIFMLGNGASESADARSHLIVHGGQYNDSAPFIVYADQRIGLSIDGLRTQGQSHQLVVSTLDGDTTSPTLYPLINPHIRVIGEGEHRRNRLMPGAITPDNLFVPVKQGGGGGTLSFEADGDGHTIVTLSSTANRGPEIATGLTVGEWYTMVLAARKSANMGSVTAVNRNSSTGNVWQKSVELFIGGDLFEDFEVTYMPFQAKGGIMWLSIPTVDAELHVRFAGVYRGIYFGPHEGQFAQRPSVVFNDGSPTNGYFHKGQQVFDKTPTTSAAQGWVCSMAGFANDGTAWSGATAYAVDDVVVNAGNVYRCTMAGTSAGSGGPTGTGIAIADNTVVWRHLAADPSFLTMAVLG